MTTEDDATTLPPDTDDDPLPDSGDIFDILDEAVSDAVECAVERIVETYGRTEMVLDAVRDCFKLLGIDENFHPLDVYLPTTKD